MTGCDESLQFRVVWMEISYDDGETFVALKEYEPFHQAFDAALEQLVALAAQEGKNPSEYHIQIIDWEARTRRSHASVAAREQDDDRDY